MEIPVVVQASSLAYPLEGKTSLRKSDSARRWEIRKPAIWMMAMSGLASIFLPMGVGYESTDEVPEAEETLQLQPTSL